MAKKLETEVEPDAKTDGQPRERVIEMTPERKKFWKKVIIPMVQAYERSQKEAYYSNRPIGRYAY